MDRKGRLMGVAPLGYILAIARPEGPEDEIRPLGQREVGQAVDATILPNAYQLEDQPMVCLNL